jgi:transposase-like protein
MTIDFSLKELLDETKCYEFIASILHPEGLSCPNGHGLEEAHVHRRDRAPILLYRCDICNRLYNVFTETELQGTRYSVIQIVQMLRGIAQGETTSRLAREMGVDRKWLLVWRHKLQQLAKEARPRDPLPDTVVEADEMYQNSGEKKRSAPRPGRPTQTSCQQTTRSWNVL